VTQKQQDPHLLKETRDRNESDTMMVTNYSL